MAIQQAQFIKKPEKEDALSKVNRGIGLALNVIGAVRGVQDLAQNAKDSKLKELLLKDQQEGVRSEAGLQDLLLGGKVKEVAAGTAGAVPVKVRSGGGVVEKSFLPNKEEGMTEYQKAQLGLEREKLAKTGGAEDKLKGLGAEGKNKLGYIVSGLDAVKGMEDAISQGIGPSRINPNTPIIGGMVSDTPFTRSQRIAAEMFGRLQSGGAINKEEEARFIQMGPRPGDSADQAQAKLEDQRRILEQRVQTMGLNEQDLSQLGIKLPKRAEAGNVKLASDVNKQIQNKKMQLVQAYGSEEELKRAAQSKLQERQMMKARR